WNPFVRTGKFKALGGTVYYGSSKRMFQGEMYPYKILDIGKSDPDSSRVWVAFNGVIAYWTFNDFSAVSWDQYHIEGELYRFKTSRKEGNNLIVNQLFFDLQYGVVKYITDNGDVWKRINI